MELLEDVVLDRAAELSPIEAAVVGGGQVERHDDDRGRVDRHRHRDLLEVDAVEQLRACRRSCRPRRRAGRLRQPTRGLSLSRPISVGRSNAVESPVCPFSSRNLNRSFVCRGVPKPANCRIVHSRPRYMLACTPRVNGYWPGSPRSDLVVEIVRCVKRLDRPAAHGRWRAARRLGDLACSSSQCCLRGVIGLPAPDSCSNPSNR